MIDVIKKFYEKRNLRPFECTWLIAVHVLGIIGLVYAFIDYTLIPKILLTHCIFHNLYALGITTGAHRLWSHKAYKATNLWKGMIMLLNSGIFHLIVGANQGSIFHWSRDHRLHHKYSDT